MAGWTNDVLGIGLAISRQGLWMHATLVGTGLLGLVLGKRAERPAAAMYGAVGGALVVHLAVALLKPKLPVTHEMALAIGGAVVAVIGLAAPIGAVVITSCALGVEFGIFVAAETQAQRMYGILGGLVFGAFAAALLWDILAKLLAPTLGGFLIGLGAWGAVGASGLSPSLFRQPLLWTVAVAAATLLGLLFGAVRAKSVMNKVRTATASSEADSRKRRDDEARARFDKYLGR